MLVFEVALAFWLLIMEGQFQRRSNWREVATNTLHSSVLAGIHGLSANEEG
jgi:hypothetical protein